MKGRSKISIICNKNLKGISKVKGIKFEETKPQIKVGIINLMPLKEEVEYQFFSMLGRYNLKVELEFLYMETHRSKNTAMEYIEKNYVSIKDIEKRGYDGLIITGAPIEHLEFEEVSYWEELSTAFELDIPSIYICWASQGALYKHYNILKYPLEDKIFGIYKHRVNKNKFIKLDDFYAPHSRNTYNKKEDILKVGLDIIAESERAGVYMAASKDLKKIYISGHGEYQKERLEMEYKRDLSYIPENYYTNNDPTMDINFNWDPHRKIFYKNWLYFLKKKIF